MITTATNNLKDLNELMNKLPEAYYTKKCDLLNASIGEHVRHILEFYIILVNNLHNTTIKYHHRNRDKQLETDIAFVSNTIDQIIDYINNNYTDKEIQISVGESIGKPVKSSYYRELLYCFEHSIHHQALIKVALQNWNLNMLIDENFGVAPSTIKYKKLCAQ